MSRRAERREPANLLATPVSIADLCTAAAGAEGRSIDSGLAEAFELSAEAVRLEIPASHLAAFVQGYLFGRRRP